MGLLQTGIAQNACKRPANALAPPQTPLKDLQTPLRSLRIPLKNLRIPFQQFLRAFCLKCRPPKTHLRPGPVLAVQVRELDLGDLAQLVDVDAADDVGAGLAGAAVLADGLCSVQYIV